MNTIDWNKEKENLKHKLEEEKLTIDEVANQYGVSVRTIRNKCKLFNIKKVAISKKKVFLSKEEKAKFKKLFESGKEIVEIIKVPIQPNRKVRWQVHLDFYWGEPIRTLEKKW